ncbi:hypothetical protein Adt_39315 [Abeliophyllum distichum]|uniref:Uncharacterized protein n=1 Tax=Abeliophyllum distichum TaxID=126358 RepID=A0ABD1Q5N4_9LAMI
MTYNRSDNHFSGLNDIPIPWDIVDEFGVSTDPIDLDDIQEDIDIHTNITIGSSTKQKATKQKARYWQHFELVPTGKLIDGILEHKIPCKYCKEKLACLKGDRHE